jgi:hypothetical protein
VAQRSLANRCKILHFGQYAGCFSQEDSGFCRSFHSPEQLGQTVNQSDYPEPLTIIDRWVAADNLARGYIAGNSTLCGGDRSVANRAVTSYPYLPGENNSFAYCCRSCKTDLSAEQGIGSHGRAVANLYQIVDFGSASNPGFPDRGSVDTGVRLDLNIVIEDCGAGLQNLVPAPIALASKSEAIGSHNGTVLQNDVVAEPAVFADNGVGVEEEIFSGAHIIVDHSVGKDNGIVADDHVPADDRIGSDMSVRADLCRG